MKYFQYFYSITFYLPYDKLAGFKDHASGVERYREMARVAVSGRYSGGLRGRLASVMFDLRLAWDWVKTGAMKFAFSVALSMGYLPDLLEEVQSKV